MPRPLTLVGFSGEDSLLAPLAIRGLVDGTALAAPLPILPPCVCCLVDADLGLRATISAARFALAPW